MFGVSVIELTPSPLVGEDRGGGPAASAAEESLLFAEQAADAACSTPPPHPPHKGEGLKRLALPAGATMRARRLRKTMTDAERRLWSALRSTLPDQHWRKQVPFGPYIADFCSHGTKLIIEVDGGQHDGARDEARTRFLNGEGYRVIRFWNNEVLGNIDGVLEATAAQLSSPSARAR